MKGSFKSFHFVTILSFCISANAQFIVDQRNEPPIPGFTWLPTSPNGGTGQSFIPSLNSLDWVELQFFNESPVGPASFMVMIRNGSIGGSVVGVSQPLVVPVPPLLDATHFNFPSSVSLTAGNPYVLEIAQQTGGAGWGVRYGLGSDYPAGQAFSGGNPVNVDLWFREGVTAVPEPAVYSLSLLAVAGLCFARKLRRS